MGRSRGLRIRRIAFAIAIEYNGRDWAYIGLPLEVLFKPVLAWIERAQAAGEEKDWSKFYANANAGQI